RLRGPPAVLAAGVPRAGRRALARGQDHAPGDPQGPARVVAGSGHGRSSPRDGGAVVPAATAAVDPAAGGSAAGPLCATARLHAARHVARAARALILGACRSSCSTGAAALPTPMH